MWLTDWAAGVGVVGGLELLDLEDGVNRADDVIHQQKLDDELQNLLGVFVIRAFQVLILLALLAVFVPSIEQTLLCV